MVGRIHVVTDSGSDLPREVRERLNIHVVPLTVQFGDEIFKDGEEITTGEFYARLRADQVIPSTCQPSPADFVQLYEDIAQPGDTIISVHLSSKMSGTYQSAVLASSMIDPAITVKAVDSKTASMGIGLVAVTAAKAVEAGKTVDEVLSDVQHIIDHSQVYFVVDTLEFLKKNGRIGLASALVGTLLNIKPILTLVDGQVAPFEKIRGKSKALKRIRELAYEFQREHAEQQLGMGLSHADSFEEVSSLAKELTNILQLHGDVLIGDIGPTIGVHTGPGTIAVFLYPI